MHIYQATSEPEQLCWCAVPTFNAKQHIMAAFASWDSDRSRGGGFITQGRDTVLQSIGALIGVPSKDSSGTPPHSPKYYTVATLAVALAVGHA